MSKVKEIVFKHTVENVGNQLSELSLSDFTTETIHDLAIVIGQCKIDNRWGKTSNKIGQKHHDFEHKDVYTLCEFFFKNEVTAKAFLDGMKSTHVDGHYTFSGPKTTTRAALLIEIIENMTSFHRDYTNAILEITGTNYTDLKTACKITQSKLKMMLSDSVMFPYPNLAWIAIESELDIPFHNVFVSMCMNDMSLLSKHHNWYRTNSVMSVVSSLMKREPEKITKEHFELIRSVFLNAKNSLEAAEYHGILCDFVKRTYKRNNRIDRLYKKIDIRGCVQALHYAGNQNELLKVLS